MKNLKGPFIGLRFLRHNSVVIDTSYGLTHFPHLTMQAKNAAIEESAKPSPVHFLDNTAVPPMTTKTVTAFADHPSEWHTTGTMTPVEKFTQAASLLKSHSISTKIDKKSTVRITNITVSPYLIKKNTRIAEFSVVTPEQSKFIRPMDTAILKMIPECDPDLTTYLSELLRTNKPEQQNNRTTPFGSRHLKFLVKLKMIPQYRHESFMICETARKKLSPRNDAETGMKFLKLFDLTDTLLTETEKHALESILVEYHDILATHKMDVGMNTEFKMRLTPKNDKAVYNQSLPMPIHLKEDLIVELALMHKHGIITVFPSQNMQVPFLHSENSAGIYVSLWISGKSTT